MSAARISVGTEIIKPTGRLRSIYRHSEHQTGINRYCDLKTDIASITRLIFKQWINILLIFVPIGITAHFNSWSPIITFFANFLAMIPLANILGDSTECLAEHLGETIGGLLNATFGNAVEMVVMILALIKAKNSDSDQQETLLTVVQTSLIGSIFSNSLLVLGCAFLANGIYNKECEFNLVVASANVELLLLAAFVLILPGPYAEHIGTGSADSLMVSRAAAIILLVLYCCLLVFVLGGNKKNDQEIVEDLKENDELLFDYNVEEKNNNELVAELARSMDVADGSHDEDKDELELSLLGSVVVLLGSTVMVALLSEFLVDSIDPMAEKMDLSPAFIGIILLPIIGNAVEHITAIRMAAENKMDIAIAIAIGSATQVAMFVVSLAVLIAWMMGLELDLAFNTFEINLFLYSTIIIFTLVSDGKSNWLEGTMLLALYTLIGIAVWPQDYSKN